MMLEFDTDDDPLRDDEEPDGWDDDEDAVDLVECRACGAEVYEDAVQCPVCGEYVIAADTSPWKGRPLWWIVLAAAGVAAVIWALAL